MGFAQKNSKKPGVQAAQLENDAAQKKEETVEHPNQDVQTARDLVQSQSTEETGPIQAKLKMGQVGDKYEKEADDTAARVISKPDPNIQAKEETEDSVQMEEEAVQSEEEVQAEEQVDVKSEEPQVSSMSEEVSKKDFLQTVLFNEETSTSTESKDLQKKEDDSVQQEEVQEKSEETDVQSKEEAVQEEVEVQSKEEDVQEEVEVQEKSEEPEVQSKEEESVQSKEEEVQEQVEVQKKEDSEAQSMEEEVSAKGEPEVSKKDFLQTVSEDEGMVNAKVEFPTVPEVDKAKMPEDSAVGDVKGLEAEGEKAEEKGKEEATDVPVPEPVKETKKAKAPPIQKKPGGSKGITKDFESKLKATKGQGSPMSKAVLSEMEQRFGKSFSHVRIHTGGTAIDLCKGIGARAFTNGADIYFNQGQYSPDTQSGKLLLAHELTHTIQQGTGGDLVQAASYPVRTVRKLARPANPKDGDAVKGRGDSKYKNDDDFDSDAPTTKSGMSADDKEKSKPDRSEVRSENKGIKKEGLAKPDADRGGDAKKKSLDQKAAIDGNLSESANEGEEKEGEEKQEEGELSEADMAAAKKQEAIAAANAVIEGKPPAPFKHPEIKAPVDSKGEKLPRQASMDTRVRGLAYMAEMFRDAGFQMLQGSSEDARLSWGLRASIETSKEDLAITKEGTAKHIEFKDKRKEVATQSKDGLTESKDRQKYVEGEAPGLASEADEGNKDSGSLASDTKKTSAKNKSETPDDPDAAADAEKQGADMEQSEEGAESMDSTISATGERARQYVEDAKFASEKNVESEEKIAENDEILAQTETRLTEMEGMNDESQGQIENSDMAPEEIMFMSERKAASGEELIQVSYVMESELLDIQKSYLAGMAAIESREDAEKRKKKEEEAQKKSGGLSPDQQEVLMIAGMEEEEQDGYIEQLEPERKATLETTMDSMVKKDEDHALAESEGARYKVDTGLMGAFGEGPTDPRQEQIGAVDQERATRVGGVLDIADQNMDFLSEEQQGMLAEKLNAESLVDDVKNISVLQMGKDMLKGMINPVDSLKGIVGGFEQMLGGFANIGNWEAWKKDPLGNLISIGADISTGLATIFTSIIGLAGMIFGLMVAITIASWGFALPFTGPVMGWMGTVMSTVGWWAVIAGALAVLFNSLSYIKNLNDAATAPTARDFFGNVDEMKEDSMGVMTGVMAITGGKGAMKMGPNMKMMKPGKGIPKKVSRKNFMKMQKDKFTALPKGIAKGAKKLFGKGKGGFKSLKAKFKKLFKKDKDGPNVNNKPVKSKHAPKGKDLGTMDGKKIKSEVDFPDGHKGKALNDGQCAICSNCKRIQGKFKKQLDADPEMSSSLKKVEGDLEVNLKKMDDPNITPQKKAQLKKEHDALIAKQKRMHDDLMSKQIEDLKPEVDAMQKRIDAGDRSITPEEMKKFQRNKRMVDNNKQIFNTRRSMKKAIGPKAQKRCLNSKKHIDRRNAARQKYFNKNGKNGRYKTQKAYDDMYDRIMWNMRKGQISESVFERIMGGVGSRSLTKRIGSMTNPFTGKIGKFTRYIDNLKGVAAREIKSGPLRPSNFIKRQIAKDLRLMKPPYNLKPEWHLFGKGNDPKLMQFMRDNGITVYVH